MAEVGTAEAVIARAQGFGLRLEYHRSGFLIARRRASTDVEKEQVIIKELGKRLAEVRTQVIALARAARGKELLGQRVLIPIIGISEKRGDNFQGRVLRAQISGKLSACSGNGDLTVSYVEIRDGERLERTTICAFDEAFLLVGSGDEPGPASSFASIPSEKIKRALECGQSIGLALEFDAGLAIAKWNAAPGDQGAGEEILRELGPPKGELFRFLEGRARGAAGSEFVGREVFAPAFDSFGVIRSCDLDGNLEVDYADKNIGSRLTCLCSGTDALIIASEEADRASSADPKSAPTKNWFRRAFGS